MTVDVLAFVDGRIGRIRLNRPRALHALTAAMCTAMIEALLAWRTDDAVEVVLIDHAEGRGFCAGGDVRAAAESARGDGVAARAFFATEYRLNHLLFVYAKPVVTIMDGVVMGGGAGLALPARYRVATERTVFAMPEATIGLFPDVGAGWYLSRLPGRLGQYLVLTAARLNGADCLRAGLATHLIASDRIDGMVAAMIDRPATDLPAILDAASASSGTGTLDDDAHAIARLFGADTLEQIIAALQADDGDWAARTLAASRVRSPQSCKVALRLLRDGARRASFADEMRAEYAIATHICQRPDFAEGVRALLIDKDDAPRWNPPTPEAMTEHMLDTIFAPLPEAETWQPCRL